MRINRGVATTSRRTFEGAVTPNISPELELRRSVMACLLWEDTFYESGQSIADRIAALIAKVPAESVASIAHEARTNMKLRHIPLLLVREMARLATHKHVVADTLETVIQRPDELTEFLAIYWKEKKQPLSAQVKRGLARAFAKFSSYQLAKYNRDHAIKLRDVMFLTHPNPRSNRMTDPVQDKTEVFKKLANKQLESPDTWEVALSDGADKAETFTRLISEGKLGALALLRNLRNMTQSGVDETLIRNAIVNMKTERVLPFRFIAAAKYGPRFEHELEVAMFKCLADHPKLSGKTMLLVDGSGSMFGTKISAKSELDRFDAACALAMLIERVCERSEIICFSTTPREVPPRSGFALRDALKAAAEGGGTYTQTAKEAADRRGYDRIIIVTDEQSHEAVTAPADHSRAVAQPRPGYIVNVASYQNGIGYGPWTHIDGWSESIINYILAAEHQGAWESDND